MTVIEPRVARPVLPHQQAASCPPTADPSPTWALGGLAAAGLGVVAVGLRTVAAGLVRLRFAHTYRQAAHEGIGFLQVGQLLVAGGLVAALASVGVLAVGRRMGRRWHHAAILVTGIVGLTLVASFGVTWWVEAQGERCIGGCG